MTNEIEQAKAFWDASLSSEVAQSALDATTQAIYTFALPLLEKATVHDVARAEYSALRYAMLLFCEADLLVNDQHNPTLSNQLAQAALLLTLEESVYQGKSNYSFGARLLFDVKKAGINLKRGAIAAFLAQEGTWTNNRSKGDLLNGNLAAVGLYGARLKCRCYTLAGKSMSLGGTEEALEKIQAPDNMQTPQEVLSYYLKTFTIPYLQSVGVVPEKAAAQVDAFLAYLSDKSDFYVAPCSTKYHLCVDGGLAEHTINVLMQAIWLTLPATREQMGACVLAAIGHDLCKTGVYHKQYKSKKIYLAEGEEAPAAAFVKEDGGGKFCWADSWYYEFQDAMPFGHGRKSAYMLQSFFPEIGEDVYSAVDGHMGDEAENSLFMELFAENPMALNLHIADILAANIVEAGK